jgi:hypothetical protein
MLIGAMTLLGCANDAEKRGQTAMVQGLGLSEQDVIDSYIYILGRYLVIRQEHIDMAEEGVDYNVIKYNELGQAEFVNPNLDVAYLEAWLAVDENTPVILEIPRIEGRYYTAQLCGEWADIVANLNERNYPDHPYGKFVFALEGSTPSIPEDAVRIDLPSKKVKMLARVERQGDDDGAVALQRAFRIVKLGEPEIEAPVAIPMFSNDDPIGVDAFRKPMVEDVLASAPDVMTIAAAHQRNVLAIADFVAENESNAAVIEEIIRTKALPHLVAFIRAGGDSRGGWTSTREYTDLGDDYLARTAVNYAGIWWNSSLEVVYYMGATDQSGNPLHGDHAYVIHFQPEDLPQHYVDAYWSLTMLSLPDYRVVPNALNRFSINNLSEFQYEDDGSLRLYIAAEMPEDVPSENWLPSPQAAPFTMNLRMYVPKESVLTGEWYAPSIERVR